MFSSSIGRKILVAISGLALLGWVCGHLAGNLLVFGGPEAINGYGQSLKDLGMGLWVLRAIIGSFFLVHIVLAMKLTLENRAARQIPYAKKVYQRASQSSRQMAISGCMIFFFVAYHLAHFTLQIVNVTGPHVDSMGRHDIYSMILMGFTQPGIAVLYLIALFFLGLHLNHAVPSIIQTFGGTNARFQNIQQWIGSAIAALIVLGFASIPISVMTGILS